MNMLMRILALVSAVLVTATLSAQTPPKPDDPEKWSQPVDLELGYDIQSFARVIDNQLDIVSIVADDWLCPDGLPVTDVHWWGSYPQGGPKSLLGFEISIHADIPPDGIHPSHPGELLYSTILMPGQFTEEFYAETSAGDVFQYNADLPVPFEQVQGTIYWLDIGAGLSDNDATWGWHTGIRSLHNPLDDAVLLLGYNLDGTYQTYSELFDSQGSVAMAFELTTIPEPTTLALVGTAALGGLGILRRRKMR